MALGLYTSKIVLEALGFTDFGIYSVVGSFVIMFTLFSATFMTSTQRFLNVEIGRGNTENICKVFSVSINIHRTLAIAILIILETVGLWFLNYELNIPSDRIIAANYVFQFSIITFILNILSVPYNAVIIAYERMNIFAYITIYEAIAKFAIAYAISSISTHRLSIYALLLMLLALSVRIFYGYYCKRHFIECKKVKVNDRILYHDFLKISGWNLLGTSASIVTTQGMSIVINLFTNVIVNSAKGFALQVENVIRNLVENFMMSIRPQITQAHAKGDNQYLESLVSKSSRYSFFLMALLCFPIIFSTKQILTFWLGEIPIYTTEFVQFTLVYILMIPLSGTLDTVLLATGKIKRSQIVLSILQILNLPLSCIILYFGLPPYLIYLSYILISYISFFFRIKYVVENTFITYSRYIQIIIKPIFFTSAIALIIPILCSHYIGQDSFLIFLLRSFIVEVSLLSSIWLTGIDPEERMYFINKIKSFIHRN